MTTRGLRGRAAMSIMSDRRIKSGDDAAIQASSIGDWMPGSGPGMTRGQNDAWAARLMHEASIAL